MKLGSASGNLYGSTLYRRWAKGCWRVDTIKLKSRARLRVVKNRLPSCMLRLQAVGGTAAS